MRSRGFSPHRHDTYAIGITTSGVQRFYYRGALRTCLPGELHVLHPDETHDGVAGTADGFGYRILYVAPVLLQEALGGAALPFVAEPVQPRTPSTGPVLDLLAHLDDPLSDLGRVDLATAIADALNALSATSAYARTAIDLQAVHAAREFLTEHASASSSAARLEQVTGLDRYTLTRHFRRAFGTSPDRYRTMRRIDLARLAIEQGRPLAQAAIDSGFADQSHMTRQFKRTYGLTPARWAAATGVPPASV